MVKLLKTLTAIEIRKELSIVYTSICLTLSEDQIIITSCCSSSPAQKILVEPIA